MTNGCLLFHQGWTDIINCLALINYYSKKYFNIILLVREDSAPLINYYIKQFENVTPHYYSKDILENAINQLADHYSKQGLELLFHGYYDDWRTDIYFNKMKKNLPKTFFVEKFYITYGIDYIERVNSFDFIRDDKIENIAYENFIAKNSNKYILYHEDINRNIIIDKSKFDKEYTWVDLNNLSEIFLDCILILEKARSIHCIDSVWAALAYQLDAAYGTLKNIPIEIICKRGYREMYSSPIKLINWKIL